MTYVAGRVKSICDRCGFEYPLSEMRKEWTGSMVCSKDYDRRPYELTPPKVKAEGVPVPDARPDNQNNDSGNTTSAEDL